MSVFVKLFFNFFMDSGGARRERVCFEREREGKAKAHSLTPSLTVDSRRPAVQENRNERSANCKENPNF